MFVGLEGIYRGNKMQENNFTQTELNYISEIKRIGREKGNCKTLSDLCRNAKNDKSVSKKAYKLIYSLCMDFVYPR